MPGRDSTMFAYLILILSWQIIKVSWHFTIVSGSITMSGCQIITLSCLRTMLSPLSTMWSCLSTMWSCFSTTFTHKFFKISQVNVGSAYFFSLGRVNFNPEICLNSARAMVLTDFTYFFTSSAKSLIPVTGLYKILFRFCIAVRYGVVALITA
jgi:hypothetical protein